MRGADRQLTRGSVCAIGGFDGVHRGHQRIVAAVKMRAAGAARAGIITFHPLPIFLLKSLETFYLTPEPEKEQILAALGIDFVHYICFTREFAGLAPPDFVDYIARTVAPAAVVVGDNFHFGRDRKGTPRMLAELAAGRFQVEVVERIRDDGAISSTRIRELLLLGRVDKASRLLGREFAIHGRVIKGKGKGTQLGYPTINVAVDKEKLLPLDGVYKTRVQFDHREYMGGMFSRQGQVEVHLINFHGDLYDRPVVIRLVERIRDIREFTDDGQLKKAIFRDIKKIGGDEASD